MPQSDPIALPPVVLVCGDDEFTVKQRARQIYNAWSAHFGGLDHEIIDAAAAHSGDALAALGKLREALQTLPFFGSAKAVWFRNCSFLGEDRTAGTQAVTQALASLADELKSLPWSHLRLLISAGKVDKRKSFFKSIEKLGATEVYASWSIDDRHWASEAESIARRQLEELQKKIAPSTLTRLVSYVGPSPRQLHSEIEKLALYASGRSTITQDDVDAIVTRNKHARAFALAEALGARDLPRVLRTLDEELWEARGDSQKSEIGLLYSLISKVRVMIFLKEMIRERWIKPSRDFNTFKASLSSIPAGRMPDDPRFNPLAMNPFILFKALEQTANYSIADLIRAMELLLECNQRLISSAVDGALLLQQTLVKIVSASDQAPLS